MPSILPARPRDDAGRAGRTQPNDPEDLQPAHATDLSPAPASTLTCRSTTISRGRPSRSRVSSRRCLEAAHYKHAQDNPPDGERDCFRFGRLAHSGQLEPLQSLRRYVVMPDLAEGLTDDAGQPYKNPKATNAYKAKAAEFRRVNADKEVVSQEWFDQVCGIIEQLNRHEVAKAWLSNTQPAEVSIAWTDPLTGLRCKGRLDKLNDPLIVDLKTTSRSVAEFERDVAAYAYDVQAAFYIDGLTTLIGNYDYRFGIVAVERNAPHAVRAAELHEDAVDAGRTKYRRAMRLIAACRQKNRWPGPDDPQCWTLPTYAQPKLNLTQGGQPVTPLRSRHAADRQSPDESTPADAGFRTATSGASP